MAELTKCKKDGHRGKELYCVGCIADLRKENEDYRSFIKKCKWTDCFDKEKAKVLLKKYPKADEIIQALTPEDKGESCG